MKSLKFSLSVIFFSLVLAQIPHIQLGSKTLSKVFNLDAGDMYKYLKYTQIKDRFDITYKFQLELVPQKDDSTHFAIEMVQMKDEKGNLVEKTVHNNFGCYFMANIKTPDNKFLLFYDDKLQALDKIPQNAAKYTWLVFLNYGLQEYFFQPMLNDFWYLQRKQHGTYGSNPQVDVLPYSGDPNSTGRYFIYWKLED